MFRLGATIPTAKTSSSFETEEENTTSSTSQEETPKVESEAESELGTYELSFLTQFFFTNIPISLELDMTGVVEGDNDAPQVMGDPNIEVESFLINIIAYMLIVLC